MTDSGCSDPGDAVIHVEGVRKDLGGHTVLDGVDLSVEPGETLIVLGGSGAGKSTLLRCILGLEHPDSGCIRIWGTDLHAADREDRRAIRERMGVAFQSGALFGSMSVAENIDLVLREFTDLPEPTRSIVARIKLSLVGLGGAEDSLPNELSGGMKKRAALARALALDPQLLLCDEPSAGLDPVTAAGIDQLLLRLKEIFRMTMVVVTHSLASAFALGDRLALLHAGRVRAVGTRTELLASGDPVVERFLMRKADDAHESRARFSELASVSDSGATPVEGADRAS